MINSDISSINVEIILSIVIAASTVIYTGINLLMWFESKAVRLQKITPHVIMYLKTSEDHQTLALHVKNIGEGVAYNLKIETLTDWFQFGEENWPISKIGILKNGFSAMPPQYELKFYIGVIVDIYEKDQEAAVKFKVRYKRKDAIEIVETFHLPFIQAIGQSYSTPPETYLGQIPYYLKEINSTLKRVES